MSEPLYDYGDMIEGERMAYERKMRSQPLDMPDGPGWWAFEGKLFETTEDAQEVRMVVEVWARASNGRLYASRAKNPYSFNAKTEMFGKWTRLTMPWDEPQPQKEDSHE